MCFGKLAVVIVMLGLVSVAGSARASDPDDDEHRGRPRAAVRDTAGYRGPGAMVTVGRVLTLGFAARPAPSFGLLDPGLQEWTVEINGELLGAIEALCADDRARLDRYRQAEADRNPCDVAVARLKTLQQLLGGCRAAEGLSAAGPARGDPATPRDERVLRWLASLERHGLKAIRQAAHDDERAVAAYVLSEGADWTPCRRISNRVSAISRAARACAGAPRRRAG